MMSVFVAIFTHKRSGAVAVFRNVTGEMALDSLFADTVCNVLPQVEKNGVTLHSGPELTVGFGGSQTAEMLQALYARCLGSFGLDDKNVTHLGVVVGPGSFTGLRLGCAFGNGLLLGNSERIVLPIQSASDEALPGVLDRWPALRLVPGAMTPPLDADDPYSAPVTVVDVAACLSLWPNLAGLTAASGATLPRKNNSSPSFVPVYGREPGPVLKLRSEGGNV
jgi:hypothetical protein